MNPWVFPLFGQLHEHVIDCPSLQGNPLGDPSRRPLWVYTPPNYGPSVTDLPVIYWLQGWGAQLDMWKNRSMMRRTFIELVDEQFHQGLIKPCLIAFVDAWTSLGGSQFRDSPAIGNYHQYLCNDVVPFVDGHYQTRASRDGRALAGKSSGGYGALVNGMLRPDLFAALATHSGDSAFEICYMPHFHKGLRALRQEYQGSIERFLKDFRSRVAFSKPSDFTIMSDICMSACYSPNDDGSMTLPYDPQTGLFRFDVIERWLEKDPIRMATTHADALRQMKLIYIDCGKRDEYNLDIGAVTFHQTCKDLGVSSLYLELFDASHTSTEYRYPVSTKMIADALY